MPTEWNLRYDDWMIGDGEPDRRVGEVFDWFAVEFASAKGLASVPEKSKSAVAMQDFEYRVVAELIYMSETACVIDFGLKAIGRSADLLPGCKQGDRVCGDIMIGIPGSTEIVPDHILKALRYRWRVNRVSADVTPYVPHSDNQRFLIRDVSRIQYLQIDSTESVRTHSYILHCSEAVE
jgi:hypothetical protein